jgi:PAS domain S-box-containing protein
VIEFDLEFRVVYWNQAAEKIFGWPKEEALGRNAAELIVPEAFRPQVAQIWASLLAQRGGQVSINENLTRDGRTIVCEWVNTPLTDGDGKLTGVMSLTVDVSERERAAQTLARTQRLEALAVLAGGIAHDFNNLLTGILANVSLARSDHPPEAELDELLEEATAAAQRATTLTRQLLTFSKGGAPVKKVVDLAPLVREAGLFATRGATGACAFQLGASWPAEVDPGQIAQVVQNLVLNALEAMPEGGTVEVALDDLALQPGASGALAAGPYLRLRVSDHGVGIPPASLPRIFDPFFSTKNRGSGLGLAVCHSVVTRHGGSIEARSTPGAGTTFEVLLPAQPGAVAGAVKAAQPAAHRRGRVLVMDDEEMVRRVAQRTLASLGCEASVAADGAEAVRLWQAARDEGRAFDLVVLDLTVPGGVGGVETLARMKALDPEVRAVVSSGYSNAPVIADYRSYGFKAALLKPFTAEEARAVIAGLLP